MGPARPAARPRRERAPSPGLARWCAAAAVAAALLCAPLAAGSAAGDDRGTPAGPSAAAPAPSAAIDHGAAMFAMLAPQPATAVRRRDGPSLLPSGRIDARSGQVIEGMHVSNPLGPCIVIGPGVRNVIVRNSRIGPCGPSALDDYGVWIMEGASEITVRDNLITDVGTGVKVWAALSPVVIERNRFERIRGPSWNGQAVQFNNVRGGTAASRVTCNVSDAEASSGVEDHISIYMSDGLPGQPIQVAYNRVRGGASKVGSGITVGDHGGSWIHVHDNVVVTVANAGIGVAGGNHIVVERNVVDNRGAGKASLTHMAFYVRAFHECRQVAVRDNRGIARLWNWLESDGDLVPGYRHGPELCAEVSDSENRFGDTTLSAALFDEVPAPCR